MKLVRALNRIGAVITACLQPISEALSYRALSSTRPVSSEITD